jgi:hypothetical protein
MEKAYRQPTQSRPISIDTIEESVTITSDPIGVTNEEDYEDTDDSATVVGEQAGDGEFYDSPEGEEPDDSDDASSVASSKYQRQGMHIISNESMVPTSLNIEYGPSKSQQRLTDPSTARKSGEQRSTLEQELHHDDFKSKPKHVSTLAEQQLLMSSTPADSEEEEEEERSPKLPLKNYKTTTV